ncbi:hypothetical protein, partial [Paraburkholderia sp. SIMBA_053]|uniref:hypothetical protein n=1 Tax=Paraburkholderia sp. SIMBA_053 TaxID=3085794 RepID=UPI00397E0D4A
RSGNRADRAAVNGAFHTWPAVCTHSLNRLTRPARSARHPSTLRVMQTVKDRPKPKVRNTTSVNSQRYDI